MKWPNARQDLPSTHAILLDDLERVVCHLETASEQTSVLDLSERGVALYDAYLAFAVAVYVAKFRQLYEALGESIDARRYLVYAQVGRSILENAASLRYYATHEDLRRMSAARDEGKVLAEQLKVAFAAVDKMVRGSRFRWTAFLEKRFEDLAKQSDDEGILQVNVQTCLSKWYKDSPSVEVLYDLLCDLVHPSLGSNLTVIKAWEGKVTACGAHGESDMVFVVAPTLAGIVGAYKEIQKAFLELEAHKIVTSRE